MSRLHFYSSSDIPGTILPAFTNMVRDGQEVFEIPYDTSNYAHLQQFADVDPARVTVDMRTENRKSQDLQGKSPQTMRANLKIFRSHPYIVSCGPMNDGVSEASLTHHPVLKSIILIRRHPVDFNHT